MSPCQFRVQGGELSVVDVAYSGPICDVMLKAPDGSTWTAQVPATQLLSVGASASVVLDQAFITLLKT